MNPRKSVSLLWLPLSLSIALVATGCQKDAPAETEAPADTAAESTEVAPVEAPKAAEPAPAPEPAPGTDAVVVEDRSTPADAAAGFDIKAFEGKYTAGATTLEVTLEGTFTLNDNGATVTGTWSAQPGGKSVLLDPDSKGEADRTVEIVSADSVKLNGATLQRQKS
ncbi:hypothetical protein [Lysobacter brunescens]|uniref:Lipoprotein n=1 Tax=Lysobacter brunescens TaxID=262323 RepID=A0ABW2YE46_9GAMM